MKKRPLRNFLVFIFIVILILITWYLFFKNIDKANKDEEYIYTKLNREVNIYGENYNLYEIKFNFESEEQKRVEKELKTILKEKKTRENYIETDRCITNVLDVSGKCLASFYSNEVKVYESKKYISLVVEYEYIDLIKDTENPLLDSYVYNFDKKNGDSINNEDLEKEYDFDIKEEIKKAIINTDNNRTIGHKEIDYKVEEIIENNSYSLYVNENEELCILGYVDTVVGILQIESIIGK